MARGAKGDEIAVELEDDGATLRAKFPNDPAGATLEVRWGERAKP